MPSPHGRTLGDEEPGHDGDHERDRDRPLPCVCRGPARRDLHALHVRRVERQVGAGQDDPGDESQQEGTKNDRVPAEVRDDRIGPGAEHGVAGGEKATEQRQRHKGHTGCPQHRPQDRHPARGTDRATEERQAAQRRERPGDDTRRDRDEGAPEGHPDRCHHHCDEDGQCDHPEGVAQHRGRGQERGEDRACCCPSVAPVPGDPPHERPCGEQRQSHGEPDAAPRPGQRGPGADRQRAEHSHRLGWERSLGPEPVQGARGGRGCHRLELARRGPAGAPGAGVDPGRGGVGDLGAARQPP